MARPPRSSDLVSVLRGLSRVGSAVVDTRSQEVTKAWATSSLRPLFVKGAAGLQEALSKSIQQPQTVQADMSRGVSEAFARLSMVTEGIKAYSRDPVPVTEFTNEVDKAYDPLYDPDVHELNIEEIMMQEATTGHQVIDSSGLTKLDKQLNDAMVGARGMTDTVLENAEEAKSGIQRRMEGFEPLLDRSSFVEQEITDEHLNALQDKLDEISGAAFGQNMKLLSEVQEHSKPTEEVIQEIISEQTGLRESQASHLEAVKLESSQRSESSSQSEVDSSVKREAEQELDSTLAQVAKTISLETTNTSAVHDIDVEVQVETVSKQDSDEKLSISSSPPEPSGADSTSTVDNIINRAVDTSPGASLGSAAAVAATAASVAAPIVAPTPDPEEKSIHPPKPKLLARKPLARDKPKSTLSSNAQARKVPHSRLGRMMTFGGLAAGLGAGTVAELTRRSLGFKTEGGGSLMDASPFLTEANAKRIVDTLCRVRGAALKLGQMMSIQDSALINPQLQKIFERVRQSADFMPYWQLETALVDQFGENWRSLVTTFDEQPFAAASIGQVHLATLEDGRSVAMKIQYPGVAEGIESDINNLISTLKIANILPEGLYVDSVIEVAKRELGWECDYYREAECTKRFRELVKPYPEYYVPEVIEHLSTQRVFSTELIDGVAVDKCIEMDQDTRNYISEKILRLCLLELFRFGYMQTDPNWSNFFYNAETEQIALLDFGACRTYDKSFVDKYIHIIHGAATLDREKIYEYSKQLGFLTGHEAKVMVNAHIDAVMILGEAFQQDNTFHFGAQDTTYRIQHLVPVMLSHRMCAPPEESYSLHRKMSGVFLLCARLNGQVNCKPLFDEVYSNYKFGGTWEEFLEGKL